MKLFLGIETDDHKAQIINRKGEHVAVVEISPTIETATKIIKTVNNAALIAGNNKKLLVALTECSNLLLQYMANEETASSEDYDKLDEFTALIHDMENQQYV